MTDRSYIDEEELHAFVDDELDPARFAAVSKLIESDPELLQRVAAFRADKVRMARRYNALLARPVPSEWADRIENWAQKPAPSFPARRLLALAASVAFIVAGFLGYQNWLAPANDALVAEALAARNHTLAAEKALPREDFVAEGRDNAIAAALGVSLKVPDLTKAGFEVAAVALYDNKPGARAAKIDYRNAAGRTFTMYLRPSSSPERFDMTRRGAVRICVWQDDVLSTIMLGEMSSGEMLRVASLAYNGLYF